MTVAALWIPLEVTDFARATRFYGELLELPEVTRWDSAGERGVVYAAGAGGRVEVVRPRPGSAPRRGPAPVALELPDRPAVDAAFRRLGSPAGSTPAAFPRGHYGFVVPDPAGYPIMLWSEAGR